MQESREKMQMYWLYSKSLLLALLALALALLALALLTLALSHVLALLGLAEAAHAQS